MVMPASDARRAATTAAAVVLGGALIALVGTLLTWFELTSQQQTETFVGTDSTAGAGTAGFSVVLIVAAVVLFVRARNGLGRGWAIAAIVIAAFVTFVAGYSAAAPESAVVQFESSSAGEQFGVSEDVAKEAIQAAIDNGQLSVASGPGAWISTVGALAALVGGILGTRALPRQRAMPQQAAYTPPPPPAP